MHCDAGVILTESSLTEKSEMFQYCPLKACPKNRTFMSLTSNSAGNGEKMTQQASKSSTKFVTIFDDTYNQPDCRSYYRMLRRLGYSNHAHAVPVFRAVLAELCHLRGLSAPNVFDFASSYGIVTALTKHDVSATAFLDRYEGRALENASAEEMRQLDREWLAGLPERWPGAGFSGVDVAENAAGYAQAVGLFDQGFAEDLQNNAPSPALAERLAKTDLIIECGSVAHLMPDALDRLLSAAKRRPWLVTSPVRGNERKAAFEVMADHGLKVETLDLPPFAHRKFENGTEQARAIEIARAAGHKTEGYENTGFFFAQIYVARPADEASAPATWQVPPSQGGKT